MKTKKKLIFLTIPLIIALILVIFSGIKFTVPTYDEISHITVQEYQNGEAVSREISMDAVLTPYAKDDAPAFIPRDNNDRVTAKVKYSGKYTDLSKVLSALKYTLTLKSGETRTYYVYNQGKILHEKTFYADDNGNLWKANDTKLALGYLETDYIDISFMNAFGVKVYQTDNIPKPEDIKLMDEYNGAEKAMFIATNGLSLTDLPSEYTARRPEDVRYMIYVSAVEKSQDGWWVQSDSGKVMDPHYDYKYDIKGYDLLTGETVTFGEHLDSMYSSKELISDWLNDPANFNK